MKIQPYILLVAALLLTGCPDPAKDKVKAKVTDATAVQPVAGPLSINPDNTVIEWIGSKPSKSHKGGFKKFSGSLKMEDGKLTGMELEIDMTSIWADNSKLTGHLHKDDFFAIAANPTAKFVASSITPEEVTGNLTLRGVTKSISFPAKIAITDTEVTIDTEFALARKQFGVEYEGRSDDLVRDDVIVSVLVRSPLS